MGRENSRISCKNEGGLMVRAKLLKWLLLYYEDKITRKDLAMNLGLKVPELRSYLGKLERRIISNYKREMK